MLADILLILMTSDIIVDVADIVDIDDY
jgi:hypothetical protein